VSPASGVENIESSNKSSPDTNPKLTMQQKRERQIEKKKFDDALQLTIFNEEQKEEV
jgi:hypothetical protein